MYLLPPSHRRFRTGMLLVGICSSVIVYMSQAMRCKDNAREARASRPTSHVALQ